jgi:hypothetical protein
LKKYWSKDVLLNSKPFSVPMAGDRFLSILTLLGFSDNKSETEGN